MTPPPPSPPIRLFLVDDHPLVRAGLATLIGSTDDLAVIADAGNGEQAVEFAVEHSPDVVLMDLTMPGIDGVEATRRLLVERPTTAVVVLTSFRDNTRVVEAMRAGAVGYLLKDCEPVELFAAIRAASRGDSPIDARIAKALLPSTVPSARDILSAREAQVLRLITRGLSNKQIGAELGIAERTVKVHVGNVFRRIDVADRTSAAMWARDNLPSVDESQGY